MNRSGKKFILFLLSVVVYLDSLDGNFVFDDSEAILNNEDLNLNKSTGRVFKNDFWGTNISSNYSHKSYRPLTILTFRWNKKFSGNRLVPYHFKATNLSLHVLVVIIIFKLLNVLVKSNSSCSTKVQPYDRSIPIWKDVAFLTSILFSVHPIHVEAVSGVVGRADILSALFFFLCILFYEKSISESEKNPFLSYSEVKRDSAVRISYLVLALLFSFISVFCKEIGITSLVVCGIYDVFLVKRITIKINCFYSKPSSRPSTSVKKDDTKYRESKTLDTEPIKKRVRRTYKAFLCRLAILLTSFFSIVYLRLFIMNFVGPTFQKTDNPTAFNDSFITRLSTYNYIYFLNFLVLIWPQWLCFDWSMGCIPLIESLVDYRVVFVLLFWYFLYRMLNVSTSPKNPPKLRRLYVMSMAFLIVPFLPASNILMPVGFVIAERVLYIPSLGFCMLIAIGFRNKLKTSTKRNQMLLKACFIFLVLIMSLRTVQRSIQWKTERSLFESGVEVCPLNAKVHYNIGKCAGDRKDHDLEVKAYRLAIKLNPQYYQAMNNLANLYKDMKKFNEAHHLLKVALKIKPDFSAAWMNMGIVLANIDQPGEAEHAYLKAISYRKNYADCYFNLGNLYMDQKLQEMATSNWIKATTMNPRHEKAWSNALNLLLNTAQIERGIQLAKKAIVMNPNSAKINFNYANLLGKTGDFFKAEKCFLKAIRLTRDAPEHIYFSNLGVLYHRSGRYSQAREMYLSALHVKPDLDVVKENLMMLPNDSHT